jgi:heptosyltransferase-2
MSLPFAHRWAEAYPEDRLIAIIDPSLSELFKSSNCPMETWVVSKKQRAELSKRCREEQVDSVVLLTNSFGSYWPYVKANVKERIGYGGRWTRWLLTQRGDPSHFSKPQGERWFHLVESVHPSKTTPFLVESTWDAQAQPELLIFHGAKYGPAKQWSLDSYAEICKKALDANWTVSLMGSPAEKNQGEAILSKLELSANFLSQSRIQNLCGQGSLIQLIDGLKEKKNPVVLANDSGAMHLLSACGIPTLGLYFSTSSLNTPPAFGPFQVLEADVPCRPCFKRECPLTHYQCRSQITVESVWKQLTEIIA